LSNWIPAAKIAWHYTIDRSLKYQQAEPSLNGQQ